MKFEHGAFEVCYNEPGITNGLYRLDEHCGDCFRIDEHWFVSGSAEHDLEFVGTSTLSLELALQQFVAIYNLLH